MLADRVGRELLGDLMAMRRRWMETQELIVKWKASADRLKPPRSRKVGIRTGSLAFSLVPMEWAARLVSPVMVTGQASI